MADGPQRSRLPIPPTATLPSCLWSRTIFSSLPGSPLMILYRNYDTNQHSYNSSTFGWLNFTYSRSYVFRYDGSQNTISGFRKNRTHDFRASRCTWLSTRRPLGRRGLQYYLFLGKKIPPIHFKIKFFFVRDRKNTIQNIRSTFFLMMTVVMSGSLWLHFLCWMLFRTGTVCLHGTVGPASCIHVVV